MSVTVLHGHVLDQLKTLEPNTVQTCITSPPYWGLRAYGTPPQIWGGAVGCNHSWAEPEGGFCTQEHGGLRCNAWRGELGLEPTPQLYVEHLVSVFREVRRVLRPDGTLWLNLGDSHASNCTGYNPTAPSNIKRQKGGWEGSFHAVSTERLAAKERTSRMAPGLKNKDLVGIPWLAAFALRDDGWYLRSDNIWAKGVSGQKELTGQLRIALKKAGLTPDQVHQTLAHVEPYVGNCMPESVKDRTTKSHEYVFLLSKGKHPYCDMAEVEERATAPVSGRRNRRSVWLIPPVPYKGAHFATMPPALVEPCVRAATSPQGQCTVCGKPWVARRVKGAPLAAQQAASGADKAGEYHGEGQKDYAEGLAQNPSDVKRRILAGMCERTVTWGPACVCGVGAEPQIVLDPFGGSGTTAMVATKCGRRAITVELNETYLPLIDQRLKAGK